MIDVIIIGAGVAGMTAAIYAARAEKTVLVLESQAYGGQILQSLKVTNWPGENVISGADLMGKIYQQICDLGVKVSYEMVTEIVKNGDEFVVKTDEEEHTARAVVIATGTVPRKLDAKRLEEVGKRAISYCAICDGALYKGKPVAVIGGGNTAKYEVSYLENIASKVYSVHREDLIPDDAVAVFVAIGREPATSVFAGLVDLDENGHIVAGEDCHTSCPGVFVAGDCRTKGLRQLVTAAADGAMAASEAVKYLG